MIWGVFKNFLVLLVVNKLNINIGVRVIKKITSKKLKNCADKKTKAIGSRRVSKKRDNA